MKKKKEKEKIFKTINKSYLVNFRLSDSNDILENFEELFRNIIDEDKFLDYIENYLKEMLIDYLDLNENESQDIEVNGDSNFIEVSYFKNVCNYCDLKENCEYLKNKDYCENSFICYTAYAYIDKIEKITKKKLRARAAKFLRHYLKEKYNIKLSFIDSIKIIKEIEKGILDKYLDFEFFFKTIYKDYYFDYIATEIFKDVKKALKENFKELFND